MKRYTRLDFNDISFSIGDNDFYLLEERGECKWVLVRGGLWFQLLKNHKRVPFPIIEFPYQEKTKPFFEWEGDGTNTIAVPKPLRFEPVELIDTKLRPVDIRAMGYRDVAGYYQRLAYRGFMTEQWKRLEKMLFDLGEKPSTYYHVLMGARGDDASKD